MQQEPCWEELVGVNADIKKEEVSQANSTQNQQKEGEAKD